jgi:CheY-like chemotaxis protein
VVSNVTPAPRVLVVDDQLPMVDFIATCLASHGYVVENALDGAEAIALLDAGRAAQRFSVLLLDMELPQVDGLGVLRHLRAVGDGVAVIAMSADEALLATARAFGVRETLRKPFDLAHLVVLVQRHTQSH